jgi:hypothetical protein
MDNKEVQIELYDKRMKSTNSLLVIRIDDNKFRMNEDDVFNCRLTFGTEFETRINEEGKHEIVKITKESGLLTRKFIISLDSNKSNLKQFCRNLIKCGGYWQIDFGGILTINISPDFKFNIDDMIREFDVKLVDIVDE